MLFDKKIYLEFLISSPILTEPIANNITFVPKKSTQFAFRDNQHNLLEVKERNAKWLNLLLKSTKSK